MDNENNKSAFREVVEAAFMEITQKHIIKNSNRAIIMLAVDMSDESKGGTAVAMSGTEPALAFAIAKLLTSPDAKRFVDIAKSYADMQARREDAIHNAAMNN